MACLNINISRVLSPIKATMSRIGELDAFVTTLHDMSVAVTALSRLSVAVTKVASIFNIATSDISERMQVKYSVVCDVPNGGYFLFVEPEIVWLTEANDWSHDFDVKSNVDWVIDVEASEDDKDIVSMLFNELTIDNNTLLTNGDIPSLILKMLHNGQMLTNKHYLKN